MSGEEKLANGIGQSGPQTRQGEMSRGRGWQMVWEHTFDQVGARAIPVEQIDTPMKVIWWSAYLLKEKWVANTDWASFLAKFAGLRGNASL